MVGQSSPPRIFIAEESLTIRAMLEQKIEQEGGFEISGIAADGKMALRQISRALPDIVILDLDLPGIDGYRLLDAICAHWHAMRVIIVSRSATPGSAPSLTALLRGATACFDKAALYSHEDDFATLLKDVSAGRILADRHRTEPVTLLH